MADQLPITRQKAAIAGRSRRNAVTGKLKTALEAMVWEGLERKAAAERAELADSSVRFAMRKPHVLAFYNAELTALRTSLRARNIHRLDGIANESKNDMAKVASIKVLEQIADVADQHHRPGETQSPGVCVVIVQPAPPPAGISPATITIDAPPTILMP